MEFRIDRTTFHPPGEISSRGGAGALRRPAAARQFDQVQFSERLQGVEGRVRDLTAGISRQIRTRPTAGELDALQERLQQGAYRPDAGEIARRMLLLED